MTKKHKSSHGTRPSLDGVGKIKMPPGVSFEKRLIGATMVYVFRHATIGELGRVVVQGIAHDKTHLSYEVAGDPSDPMTAKRLEILEPITRDITQRFDEVFVDRPPVRGPVTPPPSPPKEEHLVESKLIQCDRCDAFIAMLIFADDATDEAQLEDYARMMYPQYKRVNLPAWIIGRPLGIPSMEAPSDILKIWPEREPIQRLTPEQFNQQLDQLRAKHCCNSAKGQPAINEGCETESSIFVTKEQLQIAIKINAKMQELIQDGLDDMSIIGEMADFMPDFKRLIDTSKHGELDVLCRRFDGLYHYAKLLETLAKGLHSGKIKVPNWG